MSLLIEISTHEIDFFESLGLTVINRDCGKATKYLWLRPDFNPKYKYWGGGEDNPMTGFSLPQFEIEENYILPMSAFCFTQWESHFGRETKRRQIETADVSAFARNGVDGLTPTHISWEKMLEINALYYKWVQSLLIPGVSRIQYYEMEPQGWPKGPFYDPICAVARCEPASFPFMGENDV